MNFIEMIGFIVSLLALFVITAKKAYDERQRRANPELYEREEREQNEKLKAFLHSIDMDMEEPVAPLPPPSRSQQRQPRPPQRPQERREGALSPQEKRMLDAKIEKQRLKSATIDHYKMPVGPADATGIHHRREKDAYSLKRVQKGNRALKVLSGLQSRRDMVILHEIISPPKALEHEYGVRKQF